MQALANRLAMQHFINAYAQETAQAFLLEYPLQNPQQQTLSRGLTLLIVPIPNLHAVCWFPLAYVSLLGRHRLAALPEVCINGKTQQLSPVTVVSMLLENLVQNQPEQLDASSLLQKWIQSRDALQTFLVCREDDFDDLIQVGQNFIESEQALILGHSMHPAPKSREGFVHEDILKFSPECQAQTQVHFWLIHADYVAESKPEQQAISLQLKSALQPFLTVQDHALLQHYPEYKFLPLHPWQARYLQTKPWFEQLKQLGMLFDIGLRAWQFSPTTSVRTLASFNAPWMLKFSLSVMITNSIRVNLAKECHRGQHSHLLWQSTLGKRILQHCPSLKAINDPAWMAIKIDQEIVDETICIFRDMPFSTVQQVSCMASLCQDHPCKNQNQFNLLFTQIQQKTAQHLPEIALNWFKQFLDVALQPMMQLYHHGMAFEAHQQNVLLELESNYPKRLWIRDNQGFYYIKELAQDILAEFPDLDTLAQAVGSQDLVDERFAYYFFGNTIFGLINAIGATGYISEQTLVSCLQDTLQQLLQLYPNSSLIRCLIHHKTLAYKANLLTRLHNMDELMAPVAAQSVYVHVNNPLYLFQQNEVCYA